MRNLTPNNMLTKQWREMERQADVVTLRCELPSGNYMLKTQVIEYVKTLNRDNLHHIVELFVPIQTSTEGIEYFPTSEIQNVMMPDLFREMECHVSTLSIFKR